MKPLAIFFLLALAASARAAAPPPTEVVIVCALHQLHEQTSFYSYADLSAAIERLQPDVLAVELSSRRTSASIRTAFTPCCRSTRGPWSLLSPKILAARS
jgi:hypothetical protein